MKNKYFYTIYKLKIKSWIKYWLIKQTEFKGVLSDILEGISFYLTDSLNMKFKIFDIIGRSVQDGDPTPENPFPIKNTGDNGSVNEKVQSKNLATIRTDLQPYGGTVTNSVLKVDTTGKRRGTLIKIKPSTNYVLSKEKGTTNFRYFYFDKEPVINETITIGGAYLGSEKTVNITTPANAEYIYVQWTSDNDTSPCGNVQIEEGSTATKYVPYEASQTLSFPLVQGQKLMEGDYLADDGVHHKMGEIDLSTLTYTQYATNKYRSNIINNIKIPATQSTIPNMFAEKYRPRMQNGTFENGEIGITQNGEIILCDTTGTPSGIIQYKLAEEQTEDFTSEQKEAWEQIKALRTYKNVTHISSEDETPALLKIQYWKEA